MLILQPYMYLPLSFFLFPEMLKWTVSRSLSTASSTPHGPGGGKTNANTTVAAGGGSTTRRPFRDLSNTPPAASSSSRTSGGGSNNVLAALDGNNVSSGNGRPVSTAKRTPSRRRRCRSHGSDLRGYFQVSDDLRGRLGESLLGV